MTETIKSIKALCRDIHLDHLISDEQLQSCDEYTLNALLDYCQQWWNFLYIYSDPVDEEMAKELLSVDWRTYFTS